MCAPARAQAEEFDVAKAWSSLWVFWNAELKGNGNRESRSPKWDGNRALELRGCSAHCLETDTPVGSR